MDAKEFLKLKEEVGKLQRERDRADGALIRAMDEIRRKWGVESLQEAEEKLQEIVARRENADSRFGKTLRKFREKWGDRLQR